MTRIRDQGFTPMRPRQATHGVTCSTSKSTYDAIANSNLWDAANFSASMVIRYPRHD
jgi:hypothetical protein